MRIEFHSSHVNGDVASGRLSVQIWREARYVRETVHDEVTFEVPPDFYTHDDAVAAALMTLVGAKYRRVAFNFPISTTCAGILRSVYGLEEVGPVDLVLAPRPRGSNLALNLSGGLDSTALWWLLAHELGEEVQLVTSDYGGYYAPEGRAVAAFGGDVLCRTNLRFKQYDRLGRFNAAVPLLFADYLDLGAVTSAHTIGQDVADMQPDPTGRPPAFLAADRVYHAGGLDEAHLVRCLHSRALMLVLVQVAPHLIEPALAASADPAHQKYFWKAVTLRDLHGELALETPPYLRSIPFPANPPPITDPSGIYQSALLFAKQYGVEFAARLAPGLERVDVSFVHDLTFNYFTRYNPNFIQFIPERYRNRLLDVFHRYGIYPYDERDWRELAVVNAFRERVQQRGSDAADRRAGRAAVQIRPTPQT